MASSRKRRPDVLQENVLVDLPETVLPDFLPADLQVMRQIRWRTGGAGLASGGDDDNENHQIFTPQYIVREMCELISKDFILDFSKTILEPSSGDGAFTTHILAKRFERAVEMGVSDLPLNCLRALSTIYSIEIDKKMIGVQRSNIYTMLIDFFDNHGFTVIPDGKFDTAVKGILAKNFIWARFLYETEPNDENYRKANPLFNDSSNSQLVLARTMPKKNSTDVLFPVWTITEQCISFVDERVEVEPIRENNVPAES